MSDWAEDAVCGYGSPYPAELWWPADDGRELVARELCRTCPVRPQCLAYAEVAREPTDTSYGGGIWGGLTGPEREWLRRKRGWRPGMPAPAVPVMTPEGHAALFPPGKPASEWARWLPAVYWAGVAARWQAEQRRAS